jgi:hypothetical protein
LEKHIELHAGSRLLCGAINSNVRLYLAKINVDLFLERADDMYLPNKTCKALEYNDILNEFNV